MNMEDMKNKLLENKDRLPKHVAIIMDGNGRWATARGEKRSEGHKAGADRVKPIAETCEDLGIEALTVYAFSTENWQRPEEEVGGIMSLLGKFIDTELEEMKRKKVRLRFPGDKSRIPAPLREKMEQAESETGCDYNFTLSVCVSYGGRDEILFAAKSLVARANANEITPDDVDEAIFSASLFTAGLPDPDLLIRTGDEKRISNFLLWQAAYAEIIFHPAMWPDFYPEVFMECLEDYMSRDRRFGKVKQK